MDWIYLIIGAAVLSSFIWTATKMPGILKYWTDKNKKLKGNL